LLVAMGASLLRRRASGKAEFHSENAEFSAYHPAKR
jgi:hypothetical protein